MYNLKPINNLVLKCSFSGDSINYAITSQYHDEKGQKCLLDYRKLFLPKCKDYNININITYDVEYRAKGSLFISVFSIKYLTSDSFQNYIIWPEME